MRILILLILSSRIYFKKIVYKNIQEIRTTENVKEKNQKTIKMNKIFKTKILIAITMTKKVLIQIMNP